MADHTYVIQTSQRLPRRLAEAVSAQINRIILSAHRGDSGTLFSVRGRVDNNKKHNFAEYSHEDSHKVV